MAKKKAKQSVLLTIYFLDDATKLVGKVTFPLTPGVSVGICNVRTFDSGNQAITIQLAKDE